MKRVSQQNLSDQVKKTLWGDWKFWTLLLLPVFLGLYLGYKIEIVEHSFHSLVAGFFSSEGIPSPAASDFFKNFKYSFYIAGVSLPLAGIYAAIFRSRQASFQMVLTDEHNKLNNHFKHLSEFDNDAELQKYTNTFWESPKELYRFIYPNSSKGIFDYNEDLIRINQLLNTLGDLNAEHPYKIYKSATLIAKNLSKQLAVSKKDLTSSNIEDLINCINKAVTFSGIHNNAITLSEDSKKTLDVVNHHTSIIEDKRIDFNNISDKELITSIILLAHINKLDELSSKFLTNQHPNIIKSFFLICENKSFIEKEVSDDITRRTIFDYAKEIDSNIQESLGVNTF